MEKYKAIEDIKKGDMVEIINNKGIRKIENTDIEWIKIDSSVIPAELFKKYGCGTFEIMKRKMRDEYGKVWKNINYFNAQKECEKLGYRLPNIREMLMLLEYYKNSNKKISFKDKEYLGIEELSYDEEACYEWIYNLKDIAFVRGGDWDYGAYAGVFTLYLYDSPTYVTSGIGFRCVR